MVDVLTKQQRSYCMSRIKGKNTEPEIKLRKALWNSGFRYRIKSKLPGKPDFFFLKHKVAIFIDGCFWHGCTEHCKFPVTNPDFWKKKIHGTIKRDKKAGMALIKDGWTVIRFWEHEVKESVEHCVSVVKKTLQKQGCTI